MRIYIITIIYTSSSSRSGVFFRGYTDENATPDIYYMIVLYDHITTQERLFHVL